LPNDVLHVDGASAFIRVNRTDGEAGITLMYNGSNTTRSNIATATNGDLIIDTANAERMRIDASGNVGIGTSSPAGLQSWAKGTRILDLKLETTPVTGDVGVQFRANTGAYLGLAAGGGTGIGIVIHSNNKVGIGTTSPSLPLTIIGDDGDPASSGATAVGALQIQQGTNDVVLEAGVKANSNRYAWLQSTNKVSHTAYNMALNPNGGNVGIGTTSPDTLLEIRKDTASTGYGDYPILSIRNDNASGYGAIHFQEGSSQSARVEVGNNSGTPYMGLYTTSAASGITIKGGNAGIGRTSPQSRLDVLSSARITSSANTSHAFKLEARAGFANDGNSSCIWVSDGGSSSDPLFSSQGAHLVIECRQSAGRHIYFKVGNTTTAQHIMSSDGRMGIGTTSPSERLHVSGNILASGSVTQNSDISLKDNITPIPNALDKVLQIRGVTYNRNDIEDNPRDAGVIAQEVERVLPEVVSQCENGIKSVAYGNMVGLLIEAIRELSAEIEDLKSQNNL
jgi:hypothetical protein